MMKVLDMKMETEIKIMNMAHYIIDNNVTLKETIIGFGISQTNIYKYLNLLPEISLTLNKKVMRVFKYRNITKEITHEI
jgi:hypothetical protein